MMTTFETSTSTLRDADEYRILASKIKNIGGMNEIHFCPSPGNYGDALINEGSRQFFRDNHIEVIEMKRDAVEEGIASNPQSNKSSTLIVGGGGGWCKNFSSTKHFVDRVAPNYKNVIVLPTTFELDAPRHGNVICFARDQGISLEKNPAAIFCHDMAFYLSLEIDLLEAPLWRLYAFRNDHEGQNYFKYFKANVDVSRLGSGTNTNTVPFFTLIGGFKVVATDRLHVAIAASMLNKRVFLVGGNYPKNRDLFRSSIEGNFPRTEYIEFDSLLEKFFPKRSAEASKKALAPSVEAERGAVPKGRSMASVERTHDSGNIAWKIIETNPIVLPVNSTLFREPPRDYAELSAGYLTKFDGHTLASDVFNSDAGLVFIGPPLLNLSSNVATAQISLDGLLRTDELEWEDLNRISRMRLETVGPVENVELQFGPEIFKVLPSASHSEVFAKENVVVTLNKDNKLENVRDWLSNLAENHSITSVIIYDNRSTLYTREDLLRTIKSVKGIIKGYVVDWPYKYGNTGGGPRGTAWDSDFGQYMCWEHARWRFLTRANSVVISDVDEIPISNVGKTLVEHVEETKNGVFTYPVRDCPAVPRPGLPRDRVRLHSDYIYSDLSRGTYSKKVVYMPSRIKPEAQVGNHAVIGMKAEYSEDVISRHVSGVHMAWRSTKWNYSHAEREFDSEKEFKDDASIAVYRGLFPSRFD